PERASGTDLVIFRELTGGIYFGKPSYNRPDEGLSTMVYRRFEVERIARMAFETARQRRNRVTNVDKANVLDVSQFWRDVVVELHEREFPDVELNHLYVDNAAMQIARDPSQFDVLVMGNLFGDILSDLAAVIPGSLGVLPSASLGGKVGLYEPVHGSAPDIAGKGIANPTGTMLSAAMMLRYSLGVPAAADALEAAVAAALADDPTVDLGGTRGTAEFTDAVVRAVARGAPGAGAAPPGPPARWPAGGRGGGPWPMAERALNRRSAVVTTGPERAPNRAMLRAVGFTDEDFGKPIVGIADGHSTITPCNAGLRRLA